MARTKHAVVVHEEKPNMMLALRTATELISRSQLSSLLGLSFDGNRDLYTALGYSKNLTWNDYWNMFRRGRLGKRIISAPVESTWRGGVTIMEDDTPNETAFEKAWKELDKKLHIISKLVRADKLSSLGEFGVILLGFNDGLELDKPLNGTRLELIYLQPYSQGNVEIVEWETDTKNPRYSLPVMYSVKIRVAGITGSHPSYQAKRVHYSRIIHIAENLLDNDVYGVPRLESVFNSLQDLEKVAGGSAEMYWQGALGGKAFTAKDGATLDQPSREAMQAEIDEYIHGLRRYMRLQNIDVQNLSPQVADPSQTLSVQLDLISGDTGIPKRILIGSERGELASSQDESNWLNRIKERQEQYAEPSIIRPFVDILIQRGALPAPKEYQVSWPDLWASSEKEEAETAKTRAEALAAYLNAPGADQVMPIEFFYTEILKLTQEQVEQIEKMLEEEPPLDETDAEIDKQTRLEEAEMTPEQRAQRLNPEGTQPGGAVAGKKSPVGNLENPGAEALAEYYKEKARIDNFNPNHDARTGEFTSGAGGAAADAEAKAVALTRGYRVPPAWTNVWVNPDSNADMQVKGKDSKGRTQYIYSVNARTRNDAAKFARLKSFTDKYPDIMKTVEVDMARGKEEAKAIYLISKTGFRIGGERETGAEVHAYGATTLLGSHVSVNGTKVTFNFTGKKGVEQNHTIDDAKIASMVSGKSGRIFNTSPDKVREYLQKVGGKYKVKDFRTYVATATAIDLVSKMPVPKSKTAKQKAINEVAKIVAAKLGNTPTMAKNSYIDPAVFKQWRD